MTTTGAKVFVDTNVLLRATVKQFPLHERAKSRIDDYIEARAELWISRQVIREYIVQVTRPQSFMNPMTVEQVERQVRAMRAIFKIADETDMVTTHLLALLKAFPTGGKQVHDANIVATMLAYGIDTLLTQNVDDVKRFASRITIRPLIADEA